MSNIILSTKNLTKEYSPGKGAVDINIEVKEGEIVGFIGPNGAGKSTTMEMIMGLIHPDKGYRTIFDKKITTKVDLMRASKQIGYLPAEGGLYENLTPLQTFNYASNLYGQNLKDEVLNLSEKLQLDINKPIKKLSLGNKKKVGIIQSIIHKPRLLILDEPTSGLDPLIQKEILQIVKNLSEGKNAVFLSSHNLSEVQSVCDRLIMIKNSKIIFDGHVSEILNTKERVITLESPPKIILDRVVNAIGEESIEQKGETYLVRVKRLSSVLKILTDYEYEEFYIEKPTLESKFINFY
jgi:ABC-2 type transport system ATP-binding protein